MRKAMSKPPVFVPARVLPALLLVVALGGCMGLREKTQQKMDAWVGASDDQLVSRYGAPHGVYTTSTGARVLTYDFSETSTSGGDTRRVQTTSTEVRGGKLVTVHGEQVVTEPTKLVTHQCDVHFTLRNNRVTEVSWQGSSCSWLMPKRQPTD